MFPAFSFFSNHCCRHACCSNGSGPWVLGRRLFHKKSMQALVHMYRGRGCQLQQDDGNRLTPHWGTHHAVPQ